jgi:amidophosphoribosyltransferase
VRYPNVYGIDMPAATELIANGRTVREVQDIIGADRLIYLDLHGLVRSVRHDNSVIKEFDTSCFSGEYVTGDVTPAYLKRLETARNDRAKRLREEARQAPERAARAASDIAASGDTSAADDLDETDTAVGM